MVSLPHLVSYWDGATSWAEDLCVRSMRATGHGLTIYSYDPEGLRKTGLHDDIRDAREVIGEEHPAYRYFKDRRFTLFSNIIRLEMLRQNRGLWVDLDCYMIRPLRPASSHVYGYSSAGRLNGAVLQLPAGEPVTEDYYRGITADPLRIPWATFRRIVVREMEILMGRSQPDTRAPTNIGPRALTYYVRKHGLLHHAVPEPVFYPIPSRDTALLGDPDDRKARALITEKTVIVHLWQGYLKHFGLLKQRPPATSYLGQALAAYGM
jgi:hypothetical protein